MDTNFIGWEMLEKPIDICLLGGEYLLENNINLFKNQSRSISFFSFISFLSTLSFIRLSSSTSENIKSFS